VADATRPLAPRAHRPPRGEPRLPGGATARRSARGAHAHPSRVSLAPRGRMGGPPVKKKPPAKRAARDLIAETRKRLDVAIDVYRSRTAEAGMSRDPARQAVCRAEAGRAEEVALRAAKRLLTNRDEVTEERVPELLKLFDSDARFELAQAGDPKAHEAIAALILGADVYAYGSAARAAVKLGPGPAFEILSRVFDDAVRGDAQGGFRVCAAI